MVRRGPRMAHPTLFYSFSFFNIVVLSLVRSLWGIRGDGYYVIALGIGFVAVLAWKYRRFARGTPSR